MTSLARIYGSDKTGNAAVATVQSTRLPLATTLVVDTVENIPASFMGSMGTPHTFVDPITSEEITVISEATAVDFAGHVDGSNLIIDTIAPGYTDAGSVVGDIVIIRPTTQWADNVADVLAATHNDDGTLKTNVAINTNAATLTTPKVATSINDSNGNEIIKTPATASAVNELTVTNAAAGSPVNIAVTGNDTDISLTVTPKGAGLFKLPSGKYAGLVKQRQGGTTGDNAWNTVGTSNTDVSAKATKIQTGTVQSSGASVTTVTFPEAFTKAPIVLVCVIRGSTGAWAQLDSAAGLTSFDVTAFTATGTLVAAVVQWIAIGQ